MTRFEFVANYAAWSLADLVLTIRGLSLGFPELNPFAVAALAAHGTMGLVAYKAVMVSIICVGAYRYWHGKVLRYLMYAALTLLVLTVANNLLVLA
jgi:uncharacterized protein DUF5658